VREDVVAIGDYTLSHSHKAALFRYFLFNTTAVDLSATAPAHQFRFHYAVP